LIKTDLPWCLCDRSTCCLWSAHRNLSSNSIKTIKWILAVYTHCCSKVMKTLARRCFIFFLFCKHVVDYILLSYLCLIACGRTFLVWINATSKVVWITFSLKDIFYFFIIFCDSVLQELVHFVWFISEHITCFSSTLVHTSTTKLLKGLLIFGIVFPISESISFTLFFLHFFNLCFFFRSEIILFFNRWKIEVFGIWFVFFLLWRFNWFSVIIHKLIWIFIQ